jgi:hypothetical protein
LHEGAVVTISVARPVLPSVVAEIVAIPPPTPLATPDELMVAMLVFEDTQETARVDTRVLFAS